MPESPASRPWLARASLPPRVARPPITQTRDHAVEGLELEGLLEDGAFGPLEERGRLGRRQITGGEHYPLEELRIARRQVIVQLEAGTAGHLEIRHHRVK